MTRRIENLHLLNDFFPRIDQIDLIWPASFPLRFDHQSFSIKVVPKIKLTPLSPKTLLDGRRVQCFQRIDFYNVILLFID